MTRKASILGAKSYWRGMDVLGARPSAIVAALAPPPEPDDIYDAGDAADYDSAFLAARSLAVFGASSKAWDNMSSFNSGDIVYYSGKYYRALKDISPPFLPSVQSGDVPGSSDSWRQVSASASGDVLGVNSWEWDNRKSYKTGDVVSYWGSYWRAARAISPPMFPSIQSGEVPGDSDAWSAGASSADVMGRSAFEVLGMFDMSVVSKNLDSLKPVTIEIARILMQTGIEVINWAITHAQFPGANSQWPVQELPGGTARKNVMDHLLWHTNALMFAAGDPQTTAYASGDDLRKWVTSAYEEANAVETGNAYLEAAWNAMWAEISAKLLAIPAAALKKLNDAASALVPWWVWLIGGGVAAGAIGYGVWSVSSTARRIL